MEEMAELEEIARGKAAGIALLIERDNEIRGIRDGTILSSRVSIYQCTCSIHGSV